MRIRNAADLGKVIRKRREAAALTVAQAARLAGVSRRLLTELELGTRRNVGLTAVLKIVNMIGLDIDVRARALPGTSMDDRSDA